MFLDLIKRALKNALHEAAEEWAEEVGLPEADVEGYRARRLGLAGQAARRRLEAAGAADARAAAALKPGDEKGVVPSLPMPAAARVTGGPEEDRKAVEGEERFLA